MKTNVYIHEDFVESGEARLFLLDTNHNSAYIYLGKVADASLTVDKTTRELSHNVKGTDVEIDSRVVGLTAMLSLSLLEDANPQYSKLI